MNSQTTYTKHMKNQFISKGQKPHAYKCVSVCAHTHSLSLLSLFLLCELKPHEFQIAELTNRAYKKYIQYRTILLVSIR